MTAIRLDDVTKVFPDGTKAVRQVSLEVPSGLLLVLVGPSGCGKTTLLRLIAGLDHPTQGRIVLHEQDATHWPPRDRDVAMVFQNPTIFPARTVRDNLVFPLHLRRCPRQEVELRVQRVVQLLGLEPLLDRVATSLSGGEQQRVALGRALVRQPRLLLLDEPLAHLDTQLRYHMRTVMSQIHRQLALTLLYVTHDQEEALAIGDQVAVMNAGSVQQVGTPREIYLRPANLFVARFFGTPPMILFPCGLHSEGGNVFLTSPFFRSRLETVLVPPPMATSVILGVRPRDLLLVEPAAANVVAEVDDTQFLGDADRLQLCLRSNLETIRFPMLISPTRHIRQGSSLGLRLPRERWHWFDPTTGCRLPDAASGLGSTETKS